MIVKKKNPEWYPSENPSLKVGETIEITDPKALIMSGDVTALGTEGEELSAYELYGALTGNEKEEYEAYLKLRKQESLKKHLEEERVELEKKLETSKKEEVVETTQTEVVAKPEVAKTVKKK